MNATDFVGTWQLVSYFDIDDSDTRSEGPLGEAPRGLLMYEPHGHMSVSMMRTDGAIGANPFMGYAGTWRQSGMEMVHAITVCSNPAWADTEQVRQCTLAGDTHLDRRGAGGWPAPAPSADLAAGPARRLNSPPSRITLFRNDSHSGT